MVELSRRFFLGGAIALIAAQTFKPSLNAMGNMPTIHGDGINDDSYGLGCLFRNEPVIFKKDQLGVDEHKGVIFYSGVFAIERTVNLPAKAKIEMIRAHFIGTKLEPEMAFFDAEYGFNNRQFDSGKAIFELKKGAPNLLIRNEDINAALKRRKL